MTLGCNCDLMNVRIRCEDLGHTMCRRDLCNCTGITSCIYTRNVPARTVLFRSGQANTGLYQMLSGVVALVQEDEDGNAPLVHMVRPHDFFGHRSLVAEESHATTATTLTDCMIWHVPVRVIASAYQDDPRLQGILHRDLAQTLRTAWEHRSRVNRLSLGDRLMYFFRELAAVVGQAEKDGTTSLVLPMSYQDVALLLGHSPETVSRALSQLAAAGRLSYDRRGVVKLPPQESGV